ncbi:hypothetical protein VP01_253g3 [Puccinia sorghi]|uniref:Uncharacterized protein n=1 Tax=Puccinia sorghi TaxID=27349 RepID=A0A0L6V5B4_9BASI|nr:hypothetical protein VP01_253g3 [Puccinia sorghi]
MATHPMFTKQKKTTFTQKLLLRTPDLLEINIEEEVVIIRPPTSHTLTGEAIPGSEIPFQDRLGTPKSLTFYWNCSLGLIPSEEGFPHHLCLLTQSQALEINVYLNFSHFPGQSTIVSNQMGIRVLQISPQEAMQDPFPGKIIFFFWILGTFQTSLGEAGAGSETFLYLWDLQRNISWSVFIVLKGLLLELKSALCRMTPKDYNNCTWYHENHITLVTVQNLSKIYKNRKTCQNSTSCPLTLLISFNQSSFLTSFPPIHSLFSIKFLMLFLQWPIHMLASLLAYSKTVCMLYHMLSTLLFSIYSGHQPVAMKTSSLSIFLQNTYQLLGPISSPQDCPSPHQILDLKISTKHRGAYKQGCLRCPMEPIPGMAGIMICNNSCRGYPCTKGPRGYNGELEGLLLDTGASHHPKKGGNMCRLPCCNHFVDVTTGLSLSYTVLRRELIMSKQYLYQVKIQSLPPLLGKSKKGGKGGPFKSGPLSTQLYTISLYFDSIVALLYHMVCHMLWLITPCEYLHCVASLPKKTCSTACITVNQSLVESILENGWSNNIILLGVSACQLQAVEQVFIFYLYYLWHIWYVYKLVVILLECTKSLLSSFLMLLLCFDSSICQYVLLLCPKCIGAIIFNDLLHKIILQYHYFILENIINYFCLCFATTISDCLSIVAS